MNPFDLGRFALIWGPGVVVLGVFSYSLLRVACHWIDRSLEVKRRETESLLEVARTQLAEFVRAQQSQADAFTRLASAVERRGSEESLEHQEMLIAIKAMHREIESMARAAPWAGERPAEAVIGRGRK